MVLLKVSVSPKRGFRYDFEVSARWAPESLPEEALHWAWFTDIDVFLRSFSTMSHIVKGRQKTYPRIFFYLHSSLLFSFVHAENGHRGDRFCCNYLVSVMLS